MRAAAPEERRAVAAFFDGLERGLWDAVRGGLELGVDERDGVRFAVLAAPELLALPPELREDGAAEAGGLPIGTFLRRAGDAGGETLFHLDLQGAVRLAPHTHARCVRVSERAAQLFLYGRNVLGDSVTHHDPALRRGDSCVVLSPRNEALGIGVVVGSFKGGGEAVRPVHDLGSYLRDQDE